MAKEITNPATPCEWCRYFGLDCDLEQCESCAMFAPNMVDDDDEDDIDLLRNYDGMDYNDYLIEQALQRRERENIDYSDFMS